MEFDQTGLEAARHRQRKSHEEETCWGFIVRGGDTHECEEEAEKNRLCTFQKQ